MTDINLKTLTPDTSLPTTGFLFGADSQASTNPSVYSTQTVATTLLGSTSLTGDTLTASAPVLNLAQTWNNGAVTFKGVVVNATDTASAAASLLMDLQIAGTSKFSVKKDGSVSTGAWQGTAVGVAYGGTGQTTASAGFNALSPVTSTGDLIVGNGTNSSTRLGIGSTGQVLTVSGGTATWAAAASGSGTVASVSVTTANGVSGTVATATTTPAISLSLGDITPTSVALNGNTYATSKAARNFQLGQADAAAPVAQTLSVQSVVAGPTTNTPGVDFKITGSQGIGSGAGGSIIFQVAPAGTPGATSQNGLVNAVEISSTTFSIAYGSATPFFYLDNGGLALFRSSNPFYFGNVTSTQRGFFNFSGLNFGSTQALSWENNAIAGAGTKDLYLFRDAANILAQRNSTAAQEFRVYENTTGSIYKAILGNRQLIKISGAAFDNGAGSSAGTLTNAPAVGNPTKWIPIDDNGTTRYIPAW